MNWIVIAESDLSREFAMRTHVMEFCLALSKRAPVTFLSRTPSSTLNEKLPFTVLPLSTRPFNPHTLALIADTFVAYLKLKQLHHLQTIQVLYIRATAFGLGPLLFARRFKVPAILEINGAWSEEQKLSRGAFSAWKRLWATPVQKARAVSLDFACRLAPKIVVVTLQLADYLQKKGIAADKITVVPNGVNILHFSPHSQLEARRKLDLDPDARYIGFIGSLTAWQGLDTLIEAFVNLPASDGRHLCLLIVGDGSERRRLESKARYSAKSMDIHFTGSQPHSLIPDFIAACDVLTAPKRPLPSGYAALKILEYMACARPVVASRAPGMEIIDQAQAGLLCTPDDPAALQQTLSQMINLPDEDRLAMGERARRFVVDHYTWEHCIDRVLTLVTP